MGIYDPPNCDYRANLAAIERVLLQIPKEQTNERQAIEAMRNQLEMLVALEEEHGEIISSILRR